MGHKSNIILFLLWPIIAVTLVNFFPINAFFSTILFFGIPSFFLSVQKSSLVKKSLAISAFIIPLMIIIDYISELTHTWLWPLPNSIIPYKLFGLVSVEIMLWAFLHVYVVIMFYQYFFGRLIKKKFWDKRSKEALWGDVAIFLVFLLLLFFTPNLLHVPYWYFFFGSLCILPVVIGEGIQYPIIFSKVLKTALYFFYLNFTYEVIALKVGWWSFPGTQYIGHVSFFGVTFPFEEFFFWIMLFSLAILSYYEYFFNAEK